MKHAVKVYQYLWYANAMQQIKHKWSTHVLTVVNFYLPINICVSKDMTCVGKWRKFDLSLNLVGKIILLLISQMTSIAVTCLSKITKRLLQLLILWHCVVLTENSFCVGFCLKNGLSHLVLFPVQGPTTTTVNKSLAGRNSFNFDIHLCVW